MDLEQSQKFSDAQRKAKAAQRKAEKEAASKKREEALEFLKTRKMFKDLLPNDETIKVFKECKDYLFLNVLFPQIGNNDYCNADFARGYRIGIETILAVVEKYNEYQKEYNQVGG